MASYKKRIKIYERQFIAEPSQVMSDIFDSEKFGWSWCESTTGVHHTAIVFYLDYEAKYTVNWAPMNGTKVGSILFETEGQLIFEDERLKDQSGTEYKPCVDEHDLLSILHSEDDQQVDDFLSMIHKLSRFKFDKYENKDHKGDAALYDIASCNCRDHVESVFRDVMPNSPLLLNMLQDIQKIRMRPKEMLLYNCARFIGRFFSAFGELSTLFTNQGARMRLMDKMQAKAMGPFRDWRDLISCV